MTDYAAENANSTAGVNFTARTLAATGDTVPAGSYVVMRNSGAGAHTATFANNFAVDTGTAPVRSVTIPAGGFTGLRINPQWGDTNGRSAATMSGTVAEVATIILGGI